MEDDLAPMTGVRSFVTRLFHIRQAAEVIMASSQLLGSASGSCSHVRSSQSGRRSIDVSDVLAVAPRRYKRELITMGCVLNI